MLSKDLKILFLAEHHPKQQDASKLELLLISSTVEKAATQSHSAFDHMGEYG
jgi:hypothetical protein